MNNFFKKLFVVIIIIIFIIAFSPSYASLNLDNLAFVVAMGIDTSDSKKLKVTFQFVNPPSTTEGSSQDASIVIDSVDANSITDAINIMNSYLAKKLDLSHCKIIVFSEEVAKNGVSEHMYTLMNDVQIRPSSNLIISKCSANYYIENSNPSLETLVTKYYDIFPNSSKYTGHIPNATVGDFFNTLVCNYCQAYAILGGITSSNPESATISGSRLSENIGTAIFKDDKLVGELDSTETICFSILKNSVDNFLITIPNPEKEDSSLDLYLSPKSKPKYSVKIVNGTPFINIDVKFSAKIYTLSENSKYLDNSSLNSISNSCNEYLKKIITEYLYKTSLTFNSDISCLGKYALSNFKTNNDFYDYNWKNNYKNSVFKVEANTILDSGFLLNQT